MAPLGATNFIKVNNQYSAVIFVVFYYFCFIDYKLKSKNPQLQAKPRSSWKISQNFGLKTEKKIARLIGEKMQ